MRHSHVVQAAGQRPLAIASRFGQRLEQAIERSILAEEQDLVLAAEVVVEVTGRQVGGDGDVPHAGGREAARPKHLRRRPHDRHAPRAGAD